MKIDRFLKAALLGLTLTASPIAVVLSTDAAANNLRVVKKGTSRTLDVPMNRAVVVESDVPFAELSIANPGIADISSLSDRTIYVLGKAPGLTTLTLLDAAGKLITNVDVRVAADISEFKERLRQILPGEKIEVRTANDGIVLSGIVSSSSRLQRALGSCRTLRTRAGLEPDERGRHPTSDAESTFCRDAAHSFQITQLFFVPQRRPFGW